MKPRAIIFAIALLAWAFPVLAADRSLGCDRTVMVGQGRSMLPTLPEVCRHAVVRIPFDQVRVGEIDGDIITTRLDGKFITHRAVARLADGRLVTWGDGNPKPDATPTGPENYVGVVTRYEQPGRAGEFVEPGPRTHR